MQGMLRGYEPLFHELLASFPCVALLGPRQCGKTTLLQTLPAGWRRFDMERTADLQLATSDPDLFLRLHPRQVAIDECQALPALFPALRVAIDDRRDELGRFVLTGSSSPELLRSVSESLAGRVAIIEMAPLSWSEVHPREGDGVVARILDRTTSASDLIEGLQPRGTLDEAHDYWLWGGYPEPWLRATDRFRRIWMDQYVRTYLYRDLGRLFPRLEQTRFLLFLQILSGVSGDTINYSEVARALGVSQPTARDYFEIAHGTFLWRRLSSFERDATKRLVKHPRGHMRDSGLLHHLLRIPDLSALLGHPRHGASWEGMVIEEFHRQLTFQGVGFDSYYYRTAAGAEVDLILEGDFGLIPVEVKRGTTINPRSLRGLRDFVSERGCRFGIVVNNDVIPRRYDERLVGVPFAWL